MESNENGSITEDDPYNPTDQHVVEGSASEAGDCSELFPLLNNNPTIRLLKSAKNSKGKLANKPHACVFCQKMYQNIARHLTLVHKDESDVARILNLTKNSKERRKAWEVLVNQGDYSHNYTVREQGQGLIVPKYRSEDGQDACKYLPCEYCKGFYSNLSDLWRHQKACVNKSSNQMEKGHHGQPAASGRLLLPIKKARRDTNMFSSRDGN